MTNSKPWLWFVGVVCGAELVLAATVGGAGIGAFFGLEGAVVGLIAVSLMGVLILRIRALLDT